MLIKYRDDLGYVIMEIRGPVDFLGGKVYFEDIHGNDYVIPVEALECITNVY